MKYKFLLPLLLASSVLAFNACTDDDNEDVGASVQPAGDLLTTFSNKVDVATSSFLADSTLSKADYLYLGQYTDSHYGTTQCEFMSQFDARLGGLSVPLTSVSTNTRTSGIYYSLLTQIDSAYGDITEITDASDIVVDSAFYRISFDSDFMGDSTALQAINVYALTGVLPTNARHYTNTNPDDYCDKKTLLGSLAYQVAGKYYAADSTRILQVPIDLDYAAKVLDVYKSDSKIKTQSQFNQEFPGIYVAHSFNEGAIIKLLTSGLVVYYHFQGKIHTSYNGEDTVVDSRTLGKKNPLVASILISCNKSVERVNIFKHPNASALTSLANSTEFTHVMSPLGLYTKVDIDYQSIYDSIEAKAGSDLSRISINSASLKLTSSPITWSTKLAKAGNTYMLLINRDSIGDFFYYNKTPDGLYSFIAMRDTSNNAYAFDLSRAIQMKLRNPDQYEKVLDNLVVLPITITSSSSSYYYHQQFFPTGTRLYRSSAADVKLRPSIDLVYTRREE